VRHPELATLEDQRAHLEALYAKVDVAPLRRHPRPERERERGALTMLHLHHVPLRAHRLSTRS